MTKNVGIEKYLPIKTKQKKKKLKKWEAGIVEPEWEKVPMQKRSNKKRNEKNNNIGVG